MANHHAISARADSESLTRRNILLSLPAAAAVLALPAAARAAEMPVRRLYLEWAQASTAMHLADDDAFDALAADRFAIELRLLDTPATCAADALLKIVAWTDHGEGALCGDDARTARLWAKVRSFAEVLRADGSEKVTEQVRVTPKGLTRLAQLIRPALRPN